MFESMHQERYVSVSVGANARASVVKEMIDVSDGWVKCGIFSSEDIKFLIVDPF